MESNVTLNIPQGLQEIVSVVVYYRDEYHWDLATLMNHLEDNDTPYDIKGKIMSWGVTQEEYTVTMARIFHVDDFNFV